MANEETPPVTILQTERLILREFDFNDASFIIALLNSPGWLQYIGDRKVKTVEQACEYLRNGPMKSYAVNGYGLYMVELLSDHTPVGMCGLIRRDYLEHPDIGFAFLPEYAGKGFGFEVASALMLHAQTNWGIDHLSAITMKENTGSIRLIEKLGMKFIKTIVDPGNGEELLLYRK